MVEKGVYELERLDDIYKKKTEELDKQHREIVKNFEDLENKVSFNTFIMMILVRTQHWGWHTHVYYKL